MPTPPKDLIERAKKIFQEKDRKQRDFIEKYGHVRVPAVIKAWEGKTISILEGVIYQQTRDQPYNFVNVLHDHALIFFGNDFLEAEESKAFESRHPAIQWLCAYSDNWNGQLNEGKSEDAIAQMGIGGAWHRLAYDLYTIRDNAKLGTLLKARLLNQKGFQGARHELRVTALCIAAGFDIDFVDETDGQSKNVEFIATDRFSSDKIIVEAKSKHRRGVLGFDGGSTKSTGNKVSIRKLVSESYKKVLDPRKKSNEDLPYYVFIDPNLPPFIDEKQYQSWLLEIENTMHELAQDGYADPCPANAVFFCNDPSHYIKRKINNSTDNLWICHYEAASSRIAHPSSDVVSRLKRAYHQRVSSPENIDDFH